MHTVLTHTIFLLTSQHIQDEVHVRGEDFNALHAGYSPNGDKLVTVHLGHQVQILGEVFSESQNDKIMQISLLIRGHDKSNFTTKKKKRKKAAITCLRQEFNPQIS